MVELIDVSFKYDQPWVLRHINLCVNRGEMVGVIGPNGSGKSTLLKLINGVLKASEGKIRIMSQELNRISRKEVAKLVGVVPQNIQISFPFTAYDLVLMGRFPHLKWFQRESKSDFDIVDRALASANMTDCANSMIDELSGGERQRAFIAKALAQEPKLLLLDEPVAHLDINHQFEILDLIKKLNREQNLTAILVSHDVNLAVEYCHRLVMLKSGKILASGSVEEVITEDKISQLYETEVTLIKNPISGLPLIVKGRL